MSKAIKISHYVSKGLVSILLSIGGFSYLFAHAEVAKEFSKLHFESFIVYPLGIAKILAVLAFWFSKNKSLTEWAYAGVFFNFILAFGAHFNVGDGELAPALIGTVLLLVAYFTGKKAEIGNL